MNNLKHYLKENLIKGGLSDGMSLSDIAKKHGVELEELQKEFNKGISVEREHTENEDVAKEIAMDHLFEDPKYYTKLSKIEEKAYSMSQQKLMAVALQVREDDMKLEDIEPVEFREKVKELVDSEITDKQLRDFAETSKDELKK